MWPIASSYKHRTIAGWQLQSGNPSTVRLIPAETNDTGLYR